MTQLNGIQPLHIKSFTPVLFLLWHIRMYSTIKAYPFPCLSHICSHKTTQLIQAHRLWLIRLLSKVCACVDQSATVELGLADPWFATKTNSSVDPPADQSSPSPCPQNGTLLSQVPALKPHMSGETSTLNLHSQNLSPSTCLIVLSFSINLFVALYLHVVSTNKLYVWFLQPVVWNRLRTWRPAADHSGPGLIDHWWQQLHKQSPSISLSWEPLEGEEETEGAKAEMSPGAVRGGGAGGEIPEPLAQTLLTRPKVSQHLKMGQNWERVMVGPLGLITLI